MGEVKNQWVRGVALGPHGATVYKTNLNAQQ